MFSFWLCLAELSYCVIWSSARSPLIQIRLPPVSYGNCTRWELLLNISQRSISLTASVHMCICFFTCSHSQVRWEATVKQWCAARMAPEARRKRVYSEFSTHQMCSLMEQCYFNPSKCGSWDFTSDPGLAFGILSGRLFKEIKKWIIYLSFFFLTLAFPLTHSSLKLSSSQITATLLFLWEKGSAPFLPRKKHR